MNKLIKLIVFIAITLNAYAELSIEVSPKTPIVGETFTVSFIIKSQKSIDPFVSFEPVGVEVVGRSSSYSMSTEFVGGRSTTKRQTVLQYEMISEASRNARLTNISVDVGDETFRHENITIKIIKKSKRDSQGKIFVDVEVSNENPYVGEAVDVRYYLYTRVDIPSEDIIEFPKLNGFIKRFPKIKERVETVEYNGLMYRRVLRYPVRVFPEKSGELKIDSLKMSVHYVAAGARGIFGRMNSVKKKIIRSKVVKLKVKDLPIENLPKNFTGLVGKHTAKITLNKKKYLINEPVEVRLEVVGPGALERMDAPLLFSSPLLESFDTKAEYSDINIKNGRKAFDYTYLVRKAGVIESKSLKLAYFNVDRDEYDYMTVEVPKLVFGGDLAFSTQNKSSSDTAPEAQPKSSFEKTEAAPSQMAAPVFYNDLKNSFYEIKKVFMALLLFVILLASILVSIRLVRLRKRQKYEEIITDIYKNGLTYNKLTKVISKMPSGKVNGDIKSVIRTSTLAPDFKKYFISLINDLENEKYSNNAKNVKKPAIVKPAFKALLAVINENI